MKKLSCKDARQIDLINFLATLGHQPQKIRNQDYWYLSPFREEQTPSFKVNRHKNVWFDFGEGKGGDIIDFGVRHFNCSVNELLELLSTNQVTRELSFHPLPLAGEKKEPAVGKTLILNSRPLAALPLPQYLQKRCIPVEIAQKFCREVDFELYEKKYTAIGFKNDSGGYELRNENFKGSGSPKASSFFDQGSNQLAVFEGFFDFLSYQAICQNNSQAKTNILVLNSLAFFYKVKNIMDKHEMVSLYLDRNKHGIKLTNEAIQWDTKKYIDRSKFYRHGQDLNDWLIQRQNRLAGELLSKSTGLRLGKGRGI